MAGTRPHRGGMDERGVSPIIGTMFVFVIIVVGMSGGLVFGVPAIKDLQDRATLGDMATQLEQVREEAERLTVEGAGAGILLAPSSGTLSLENGTRMAIAISYNGTSSQQGLALAWGKGGKKKNVLSSQAQPCDFHLQDWEDGDNVVTIVAPNCEEPQRWDPADGSVVTTYTVTATTTYSLPSGCRSHGGGPSAVTCTSTVTQTTTAASATTSNSNKGQNNRCWSRDDVACLQAFPLSESGAANHVVTIADAGPDDTYTVTLSQPLSGDWYFQLSNDPTLGVRDGLLAKVYVLETDQLRWERDEGLTTWLEGGAVFGTRLGTDYVVDDPLIDERIVDNADATYCAANPDVAKCQPTYYLRLIRFDGQAQAISSGAGSIEVHLRHNGTQQTTNDGVSGIRFDFHGEGAGLWCDALIAREPHSGYAYAADDTRPCDGSAGNDVRGAKYGYDVSCPDGYTATQCAQYLRAYKKFFQVVFTEVHFDVKLRP